MANDAQSAPPPPPPQPQTLYERLWSYIPSFGGGGSGGNGGGAAGTAAPSSSMAPVPLPPAALAAERAILALVGLPVIVRDIIVGPTPRHSMRTYEVDPPPQTAAAAAAANSAAATPPPPPPPVVLFPGYGAGAGLFFRNLAPLARLGMPVLAADWLGTGLSGRPPFPIPRSTAPDQTTRLTAERFFLDAFSQWCEEEGIGAGRPRGPMILIAHSLGGYLSATYALERPRDVEHLILVCPAGLPSQPDDWREGLHKRVAESSGRFSLRPALVRWAERAWDDGVTHGSILRALGPFGLGEKLMRRYAGGRFSAHGGGLSSDEADAVGSYLHQITAQEGSGEHALRHLLGFGAWAHAPLGQRLEALSGVPVSFVYGQRDWMKYEHAEAVAARLDEIRPRTAEGDHEVVVLPDAGHFPFIETPRAFDDAVARILRQYQGKGAGKGATAAPAAAAAAVG